MKKGIYAIWDNKAQDLVMTILNVQAHEAVAIRTFTDIAMQERSQIQQHPEDFDLIRLGFLSSGDKGQIGLIPAYQLILTGKALISALQRPNNTDPQVQDTDAR